MKKILALLMALALAITFAACGTSTDTTDDTGTVEDTQGADEPTVTVMDHAAFVAAEVDTEVTVETYVQAHQSWWEGKVTVYTQAEDGAYFIYDMPATEEEAAKLVPGTKIRVTGYKQEWSGEIEIGDVKSFEILEGSYIATAYDATSLLGTDELASHMNEFVAFKGLTVAPKANKAGEEAAFLYGWDGSGVDGDDLYFDVSYGDQTYTFVVESYLTGAGTDVYEAVKALKVGDKIDAEGFLYWYEGVNPHITKVTAAQ